MFINSRQSTFIDVCKYNYIVRQESATNTTNEYRKLKDSLLVCRYMYAQLTEDSLKLIAYNRMVTTDLSLYQCIIKNHFRTEKLVVKNRLKRYKDNLDSLSKRNKIILYSLIYMPHIYCGVYGVYDKIRKPNWDVN